MIHIYYHIYVFDSTEEIVKEQISLIEKYFDFPYILNIGISISHHDYPCQKVLETIYNFNNSNIKIRDVIAMGDEWTTLDLIEKDKDKFGDSDYILYIHTKAASRIKQSENYQRYSTWRHLMNYFNIEKCKNVFKIFEKTIYNTYGVLFESVGKYREYPKTVEIYSGNFWWAKASYLKSIKIDGIKKTRYDAEVNYIQNGKDWKPYSPYNREGQNHYLIQFNRKEYAK